MKDPISEPTSLSRLVLSVLQMQQFRARRGLERRPKHMYGGTVPDAEIARRRAANKRARVSRRMNRSR